MYLLTTWAHWEFTCGIFFRLKSTLKSVIKERVVIRKDVIDIQAAERDLLLKAYRKVSRHSHLTSRLLCSLCIRYLATKLYRLEFIPKERNLERMQLLCINSERLDKVSCQTA